MMLAPASLPWFARHELRLAWRDWLALVTGGRTGRTTTLTSGRGLALGLAALVAALLLHLLAASLVQSWVGDGVVPDRDTLVTVTGLGILFFTVMLSQSIESVTRAYYGRSDLDLIFSSPAPATLVFAVRTGATALVTMALACLLASPLINMLAIRDGPHWLAAYAVLAGLAALASAISVLVVIALFNTVGAGRTRLVAQIIAGIVGAGFVIGIQAAAILAYGDYARFAILQSAELLAAAPPPGHAIWLPARAAMGEFPALLLVVPAGLAALALTIIATAGSFSRHAMAAAGIAHAAGRRRKPRPFRAATPAQALRRKEWRLLRRDPWLLSQTLMQLLYLVPPALLLWVNFGAGSDARIVVVPVLVMAAGQLAGGLAWLAVSGEDAQDLVATAPITPGAVLRAKVEAVVAVIAMILAPLLVLLALASLEAAVIVALCAALATASATAIQLWFRTPMRRAMFRRRQVASRLATLSEALASIMWAGTAALLAAGSWMALAAILPAAIALAVTGLAWLLGPRGRSA